MLDFAIPRPPRRRSVLFAMTPLIDVMFLLLIFFMLSSQIAPYSLLPVSPAAAGNDAPPPADEPAGAPALVRVARGEVTLDGKVLAFAEIEPAFARRVAADGGSFLVLPSRTATVQDLVTVLEALKTVSARNVALLDTGRTRP